MFSMIQNYNLSIPFDIPNDTGTVTDWVWFPHPQHTHILYPFYIYIS